MAARLAVLFIQQLIEFVVKSVHLSKVNRVLGAILGAGKGIVAVTLVTLACSFSNLPQSSEWQESISAPFFESLAMTTKPYLPDFLAEQVAFHHENNSSSIADENIAPETKQPVLNNSKKNIKK